jgi:hypothetical protein
MVRPSSVPFLALMGALSFACDDDKKKPTATPSATATPTATPTTSAPAAASAAGSGTAPTSAVLAERLKCDKLMPEKQLPGVLSNLKVGQPPAQCPECGPTCSLVSAANPLAGASVQYACNEKYDKGAADRKLDELKKALKKSKPVEIGRGGIGGERESGLHYEVVAWDDDSDCVVTVDWMRGKRDDAIAAAKFALAGVKQDDLK